MPGHRLPPQTNRHRATARRQMNAPPTAAELRATVGYDDEGVAAQS